MFARIKKYYFLPIAFFIPQKMFHSVCYEYNQNINESLGIHVLSCIMGGYIGALEGVFLGATWPISVPIIIKRYIDKN